MQEIAKNLFVGNQQDYERISDDETFSFLLAAKEPFHRQALEYTGRAAPKDHPEYLWAYRDRRTKFILNMVDADSSLYFDKGMIDEALNFIVEEMFKGKNVLIACNAGFSRSASLGLLFLIRQGYIKGETLEDCEAEYLRIYPEYNPNRGIREFAKEHFHEYRMHFLKQDAFIKMKPVAEKCGVTDEELKALIEMQDDGNIYHGTLGAFLL